MKIKSIVVAGIVSLLAINAQARLGETVKEIEARYGKPVTGSKARKPATVAGIYSAKGFGIIVGFKDDKSVYEIFWKMDKTGMSEGEIDVLLEANKGQSSWKKSPRFDINKTWLREDDAAVAVYEVIRFELHVYDLPFKREHDKLIEDEKKAKIKDF